MNQSESGLQLLKLGAFSRHAVFQCFSQMNFRFCDAVQELSGVGANQFGSSRGGGGAQVRNVVANGGVDFVTDSADDRHRAGTDRTRHDFFIEGPQVFQRAAPANQQNDIDRRALRQLL